MFQLDTTILHLYSHSVIKFRDGNIIDPLYRNYQYNYIDWLSSSSCWFEIGTLYSAFKSFEFECILYTVYACTLET